MKKSDLITILIIIGIVALVIYIKTKPGQGVPDEVAKCIGENSILYSQLGCHFCEEQERLFGESYQYLIVIDCFYERDKCGEISGTPTWKINNEFVEGLQQIDKLKELTGC